ncbi:MAG: arylsulfatase [Verrucomicrobia bacterium]|nr:MAG: arylsulfatase [Verrucomicrobiota bacterium]
MPTQPLQAKPGFARNGRRAGRVLGCIAGLLLQPGLLSAPPANGAAERPNIIIVLVDDMGFSDIGCYGSEIPTPNLDALAAGGVRFAQFYNTGRCCPTRASLLTGLYPHQAGVGWMTADQGAPGYRGHLNERCVTIAEVLRQAGYFTAMTGKWHVGFGHGVTPWNRGFDRSLNLPAGGLHFSNQTGPKGKTKLYLNGREVRRDDPRFNPPWYGTDLWTDWGIRFIDEARAAGKPFFLYIAHCAPHFPLMAPAETIAKYRGRYMTGWDRLRRERYHRQIRLGLIDPAWPLTPRPPEVPAWASLPEAEQRRYDHMMAIYAAMIDEIDQNVGKLVAALKQRGLLDNTLLFFLSDNGGNAESGVPGKYEGENPGDPHSNVFLGKCWALLNNTPFRLYKHYNHEGGIATPLIVHWPRRIRPRPGPDGWIRTPGHVIDLMPTCVEAARATYHTSRQGQPVLPMEGRSLLPLLTGEGDLPSRALYWEHEGNAALREGDRKLVRLARQPWELHDMRADRTEQHDLAPEQPETVSALADQWQAWARRAHVLPKPAAKRKSKPAPARKASRQR